MKKDNIVLIVIIVVIILFIIIWITPFILESTSANNLNNTKKSAFVSDANLFIEEVRNFLYDNTYEINTKHVLECKNNNSAKIFINDIQNGNNLLKSPYGREYLNSSFVKIVAIKDIDYCYYEYYVYLTDGKYSIGNPSSPIKQYNITINDVK